MSINDDYLSIGKKMAKALVRTYISGLHLPMPIADETFRDEFGFVFLSDDSVGPFYVSMGELLRTLWKRYPEPHLYTGSVMELLGGFAKQDLAMRALALGTYNALSAALIKAAGYMPPERTPNSGLEETPPGAIVGMVGYFCPLVDKLTERGCEVLILEQSPERVAHRTRVSVTSDPNDLRVCRLVLCTASTLINDTLEELLEAVSGVTNFELIGPSGSGLPDPLFARDITSVGGIRFPDKNHLLKLLGRGESWGAAGRKYQLSAPHYPGIDRLLERGSQATR